MAGAPLPVLAGPRGGPSAVVRSLAEYRARALRRRDLTSRIGMYVFLGSWLMLFAALLFVYGAVRSRAPAWPPPGTPRLPVLLPGAATAVMVAASAALRPARRALQAERHGRAAAWLLVAGLLGAGFVLLQGATWLGLWREGLVPSGGPFPSVFYGLTALHALHVLVGLAALALLAARAALRRAAPLHLLLWGLFWDAVGAVWLVIYATVYLL